MPLPEPVPALVIRYAYLWQAEQCLLKRYINSEGFIRRNTMKSRTILAMTLVPLASATAVLSASAEPPPVPAST